MLAASYPGGFEVRYTYNVRNLVEGIAGGLGASPSALVPRRAYDANDGVLRRHWGSRWRGRRIFWGTGAVHFAFSS